MEGELEEKLTSVFEKLNCERISVQEEQFGKVLEIYLGDVEIDKENIYYHCISYSKNESEELGDEILPNWYYDVLFYL